MKISSNIQNLSKYKKFLKIIKTIKEYFDTHGYLELELPVMSPAIIPESYIEIFKTQFQFLNRKEDLYLTSSPELFMKRLVADGIGNCYYFGKAFRNSELHSDKHCPEFLILEFYKTPATYLDVEKVMLELFQSISRKIYGKLSFTYKNKKISLEKFERISVVEAFEKFANIDEKTLLQEKSFMKMAEKKGYNVSEFSYEDVFSQIYTQEIEPNLGMNGYPTIIYDYPIEFAPLCKPNPDGKTAQRFELYIAGIELGNCYNELTDWKMIEARFKKEALMRKEKNMIPHEIDYGFIETMKRDIAPYSGIAVGVERLAMIYVGASSIEEIKLISIS